MLLQERAPSSRMAAGMGCLPRKGTCCKWAQGRDVQTTRRRRDDRVDCVAPFRKSWTQSAHSSDSRNSSSWSSRASMGWGVESSVKSQPPRCSEGPDERAVAWYCSPAVKLAAVSLHRVSSFMSSVGLVVNRHYARQVDDQTLDLLLSAGAFSTPTAPAPAPAPSPWEL